MVLSSTCGDDDSVGNEEKEKETLTAGNVRVTVSCLTARARSHNESERVSLARIHAVALNGRLFTAKGSLFPRETPGRPLCAPPRDSLARLFRIDSCWRALSPVHRATAFPSLLRHLSGTTIPYTTTNWQALASSYSIDVFAVSRSLFCVERGQLSL